MSSSGLVSLRLRGFRAARDVTIELGSLCALVGDANAGKSTLIAAIRALLDPSCPVGTADLAHSGSRGARIEGVLASGARCRMRATPTHLERVLPAEVPAVLYLPAELRAAGVLPGAGERPSGADDARTVVKRAIARVCGLHPHGPSTTTTAAGLVEALESIASLSAGGHVLLIEEPELYLRPQAQRHLYRLLRAIAAAGNQVIYSTHAPTFLNVGRLEEIAFVRQDDRHRICVRRPAPLALEGDFRLLTEFDAERSELFLARAALLVEGATEKMVFPFVFRALGHDVDREAITIVECGGKSNIPLFAQVCTAAGIPFVAVHDRDAVEGRRPIASERAVNSRIADVVPADRIVELAPDFDRVAGVTARRHKPERAWQRFAAGGEPVPTPLERAARLALSLARD
jgi:ABC-type branched-subunit amino acid transport system ATPase component